MQKIRKLIFIALGSSFSLFSYALDLTIPPSLTNKVAISIFDTATLKPVYTYRESAPMLLASNMKLVTTYVALHDLGPEFKWQTSLAYSGKLNANTINGDVYLIGGGDPTLTSESVASLFTTLANHGITHINGNIILDTTRFNSLAPSSELYPEPWQEYSVEPAGLIIDSNLSQFKLSLKNKKVKIIPNNAGNYNVLNQLQVIASKAKCDNFEDRLSFKPVTPTKLSISGKIPPSCNGKQIKLNLLASPNYNRLVVKRILKQAKITYTGEITSGKVPPGYHTLATITSPTLAELLFPMNKYSNNLYAKTLFLSLGAYLTNNSNTAVDSKKVYLTTLHSQFGFNELDHIENGSGLSRVERITPEHMIQILARIYASPQFNTFWQTLPTPSESGTLQDEFSQFKQQLYVKTGSLSDTKAYSGYFKTTSGHLYLISFMANDIANPKPDQPHQLLNQFKQLMTSALSQLN